MLQLSPARRFFGEGHRVQRPRPARARRRLPRPRPVPRARPVGGRARRAAQAGEAAAPQTIAERKAAELGRRPSADTTRRRSGKDALMASFIRSSATTSTRATRSFDFVGRRRIWYLDRGARCVIVISLVGAVRSAAGFHFGIEFTGGSSSRSSRASQTRRPEPRDGRRRRRSSPDVDPPRHAASARHGIRVQTDAARPTAQTQRGRTTPSRRPTTSPSRRSPSSFIGATWGADITRQAIRGLVDLPRARRGRHGALLPHLEDVGRRDDRAAARPRHHGRRLRHRRLRGHARRPSSAS